jgi:D-inositol-3-phosphate glycosyltransferase
LKRKLLWIGDAGCQSGFARCTHEMLEVLRKYWDVFVLGINYRGDPHPYPYQIYPCYTGGDAFGVKRLPQLLQYVRPDVVVLQNDVWNIPSYMKFLKGVPTVASLPVDGKNCVGAALSGLKLAIFWTEFGLREARQGGYLGPATVVPLGVDLKIYQPQDKKLSRNIAGLPTKLVDAFIVGNVNRNQPRKRLDLSIQYFSEWVKSRNISNAYLYLHVAPTGDTGINCSQLAAYYGVQNRLILSETDAFQGIPEAQMVTVYNCFDVQINTGQGEGWGLCTMEGMACGIPQIVPDWAALGEWCGEAALQVECTSTAVTFDNINAIGGVPDRKNFIDNLDLLYRDERWRSALIERGLELVRQPQYRWEVIGERFAEELDKALDEVTVLGVQAEVVGA